MKYGSGNIMLCSCLFSFEKEQGDGFISKMNGAMQNYILGKTFLHKFRAMKMKRGCVSHIKKYFLVCRVCKPLSTP